MMLPLVLFMALLLAASAAHKGIERQRLATASARLTGVSAHYGPFVLLVAAAVEVLAALALALPDLHAGGALAAAGLWSLYGLALLRRRGETLDCGCDLIARERLVGAAAILRPAMLAALAFLLGLALLTGTAELAPWTVDAPFAALALLALWFAAAEIVSLPTTARAKA